MACMSTSVRGTNESYIISIKGLFNKSLEYLRFCIKLFNIKELTCGSEANIDAHITVLKIMQNSYAKIYGGKIVRAAISPGLTPLSMEIGFDSEDELSYHYEVAETNCRMV